MQKYVSIIVPIYRGQKYISGLVRQIEEGAKRVSDWKVELLFVNDDPKVFLDIRYVSDLIDIKVINTDKNRGIHGARVRGLSFSKGECVLFLDQDDKMHKDFLEKQLALIGKADAVVCNVLHDGHLYYDVDRPIRTAISRESMLFEQCMILSPGQVLIRAESIPYIWKVNIMNTAGADDWLLWICMLCSGKKFAVNDEVLFEHKIHYNNTSIDSVRMADSENEVVQFVEHHKLLEGKELEKIKNAVFRVQRKRMRDSEKCKRMFRVLSDWMTAREHSVYISNYLRKLGIHKVAIYGFGHFGRHLFAELEKSDVEIGYIVDRNAVNIKADTTIKTLDEDMEVVDAVIIAILKDENSNILERSIEQKINAEVFWITDIISKMLASEE